jgi:hypothetical protein
MAEFLRSGTAEELAAAFGDELDSAIERVGEYMVKAPVVLASDLAAFHSDGRVGVDGRDCEGGPWWRARHPAV